MTERIDFRKESNDIVYFNATARNNTARPANIDFLQNRSQNIVDKANDYYLAIVSYDIPNSPLPIFNFEEGIYSVTIREGGIDYREFLVYIDRGDPSRIIDPSLRGIYYLQQFLDMINNAMELAHTASGATGNAPKIFFREDERFEIRQDQTYSGTLYFSTELYRFFLGTESNFLSYSDANGADEEILNKDNGNNTGTYVAPLVGTYNLNIQENKALYLWPDIRFIVITTRSIPVNKEFFAFNKSNTSEELLAISDFVPVYNEDSGINRTDWRYDSGSGYRLIDLKSDAPLRSIDYSVVGITRTGALTPIFIAPQATATVKFMFIKKSLENNEYNGLHSFGKGLRTDVAGIEHTSRFGAFNSDGSKDSKGQPRARDMGY